MRGTSCQFEALNRSITDTASFPGATVNPGNTAVIAIHTRYAEKVTKGRTTYLNAGLQNLDEAGAEALKLV
jgi:ribosome-binding ATPase YchF (GTP1/OBG family)